MDKNPINRRSNKTYTLELVVEVVVVVVLILLIVLGRMVSKIPLPSSSGLPPSFYLAFPVPVSSSPPQSSAGRPRGNIWYDSLIGYKNMFSQKGLEIRTTHRPSPYMTCYMKEWGTECTAPPRLSSITIDM